MIYFSLILVACTIAYLIRFTVYEIKEHIDIKAGEILIQLYEMSYLITDNQRNKSSNKINIKG